MSGKQGRRRGAWSGIGMFAAVAAIIGAIILIICLIAATDTKNRGGGGGGGSGSFPGKPNYGIKLQHSGQFPPNEFVFEGEMRGVSPDFARMLVKKGHYAQAQCPGDGFIYTEDPRFTSVVTSVESFGSFYQTRGDNFRFHALDNHHKVCGAAGDWGNTTTRRRFLETSSAYIKSPTNKIICLTNATMQCPSTASWDGTQVFWEPSGLVNSAECLSDNVAQSFIVNNVIVANNNELANYVLNDPGTFALVDSATADAFDNANANAVILSNSIKCSPGWGFVLNPSCTAEADCLTRANKLVPSADYNELCCQYRNPKYDAAFPNWVADNGVTFGESAFNICIDDRSTVGDEGGVELSIAFSECGDNFCDRPGDAACP